MSIAIYRLELLQFIRHAFSPSAIYYFRVSRLIQYLLAFAGAGKFKKIDTDAINNFSSINARTVNTCAEYLFNSFGKDYTAVQFIAEKLAGQTDAAKSYYLKFLADRRLSDVMLYVESLKAFEKQENIHFGTISVPRDVKPYLDALSLDSGKRTVIYQCIFRDILQLGLCLAVLLRRCLITRNTRLPFSVKQVKYVTELIDLDCFKGEMGHPDFVERLLHLSPDEVAYFKFTSNGFKSAIRKNSRSEIRDFVKNNNIKYIDADSLRAKSISKFNISRWTLKVLLKKPFSLIDTIILIDFLTQLYTYHALFDNFPCVKAIITFTFPSGQTSWRWNSGVITGVSRLHKVESIGCQTRAFYLYKYDDVLDCFDRFYFWSPLWYTALKKYMGHIKHVDYFEDLSLIVPVSCRPSREKPCRDIVTAVAFPSDCSYSQHYNIRYNTNFLKALFSVCERFDNIRILLKPKDPENMIAYRSIPQIDELFKQYSDRMIVVEQKRGDVWSLLKTADIVLGIGFTNPAVQSALAGYRVLIYEELCHYNECMRAVGMEIASSVNEFVDKCGKAIEDISAQSLISKDG